MRQFRHLYPIADQCPQQAERDSWFTYAALHGGLRGSHYHFADARGELVITQPARKFQSPLERPDPAQARPDAVTTGCGGGRDIEISGCSPPTQDAALGPSALET